MSRDCPIKDLVFSIFMNPHPRKTFNTANFAFTKNKQKRLNQLTGDRETRGIQVLLLNLFIELNRGEPTTFTMKIDHSINNF
jgi:hypothetical protein